MATTFVTSSSPQTATFLSSTFPSKSRPCFSLITTTSPSLPFTFPFKKLIFFHNPSQRNHRLRPLPPLAAAAPEDVVLSPESTVVVDATQQMDDGVTTVVSALLFVAFIGLSILTVGVIYLGVTDFLQKREKEKFEKEEEANKSGKKKKKKVARFRAGPRGFGQKVDENEEED